MKKHSIFDLAKEDDTVVTEPLDIVSHMLEHDELEQNILDMHSVIDTVTDSEYMVTSLTSDVAALESSTEINATLVSYAKDKYLTTCDKLNITPTVFSSENDSDVLHLSIESIKDIINKLIESIKIVINKVINNVYKLWIQIQVLFNNDEKIANELVVAIKARISKYPNPEDYIVELKEYISNSSSFNIKLFNRLLGLTYLSAHNDSYFPALVTNYFKLLSSKTDPVVPYEAGPGLNGIIVNGHSVPSNFFKDIKEKLPTVKNGIPLYTITIVSCKGPYAYLLLKYYTVERTKGVSVLFDYKKVTFKELIDVHKLTTDDNGYLTTVQDYLKLEQFSIQDIYNLAKTTAIVSSEIKHEKDAMIKNIDRIKQFLKEAETHHSSINNTMVNDKAILINIQHLSTLLPKMYLDKMSSLLYLNKTALMILSAAKTSLKK